MDTTCYDKYFYLTITFIYEHDKWGYNRYDIPYKKKLPQFCDDFSKGIILSISILTIWESEFFEAIREATWYVNGSVTSYLNTNKHY